MALPGREIFVSARPLCIRLPLLRGPLPEGLDQAAAGMPEAPGALRLWPGHRPPGGEVPAGWHAPDGYPFGRAEAAALLAAFAGLDARDLEGARDAADREREERRARELGELADLAAFAESSEADAKSRPEAEPSVPARIAAEQADFKSRNDDPRYRFDVMTQEALVIGNAPVSSFIAAALRLALNADDKLSRAIYNRYLGREFDRPLAAEERAFFRSVRLLSPEEAFERIVMEHDLQRNRRETAYLQAIHEQIIAFCANRIADIPLFLEWWDEQGSARSLAVDRSEQAVEILTIHKAKGLENKAVLIPYCSWQLEPKAGGGVQNIVWAEAQGEAAGVGRFPVKFKKAMAESGFSEEYYRETVYSHVDNINLLYVALTRAAESLHVFIPQRGSLHVGSLLLEHLAADGDRAVLAGMTGRYSCTDETERFEFGEFTGPADTQRPGEEITHTVLEHYPTARADLRLRLPSQRYFEPGSDARLSPCDFGILMHRAFEKAADSDEIGRAVTRMEHDGTLSADDAAQLRRMIDTALTDPRVREWFDGPWQRVRNEQEIILPGDDSTRRPDRVMIDGERAVVVDYKFGEHDAARYRRQLSDYCALLQQMGHPRTEGYLWYVKLGKIEQVV